MGEEEVMEEEIAEEEIAEEEVYGEDFEEEVQEEATEGESKTLVQRLQDGEITFAEYKQAEAEAEAAAPAGGTGFVEEPMDEHVPQPDHGTMSEDQNRATQSGDFKVQREQFLDVEMMTAPDLKAKVSSMKEALKRREFDQAAQYETTLRGFLDGYMAKCNSVKEQAVQAQDFESALSAEASVSQAKTLRIPKNLSKAAIPLGKRIDEFLSVYDSEAQATKKQM